MVHLFEHLHLSAELQIPILFKFIYAKALSSRLLEKACPGYALNNALHRPELELRQIRSGNRNRPVVYVDVQPDRIKSEVIADTRRGCKPDTFVSTRNVFDTGKGGRL